MIACDSCDEWYHGSCINLTEDQAADIKTYICQNCREDIEREENTADKSKKRKKTSSPEKKKCGNPTCSNSAAIGSKYCTYQCGIIVAKEQLKRKNAETQAKEEIVEDKNIDTEDTRTLRELRIKKQNLLDSLKSLQKKTEETQKTINDRSSQIEPMDTDEILMNLFGNYW